MFPDNGGGASYSVTLPAGAGVFLDVTVDIDALRLLAGSVLQVTQAGTGDLSVVGPGGLLNEGMLLVAGDRIIDVPAGPIAVRLGGYYGKLPAAPPGSVTATSSAASMSLSPGGSVRLRDAMSLVVTGDLTIDGTGTQSCMLDGGQTPPILWIEDSSQADVGGDIILADPAGLVIEAAGEAAVGGDFVNQSQAAECFNCGAGAMIMDGASAQVFEVGGDDLGPTPMGFAPPGSGHGNFSLGMLEITGGHSVRFENAGANAAGSGACAEAL